MDVRASELTAGGKILLGALDALIVCLIALDAAQHSGEAGRWIFLCGAACGIAPKWFSSKGRFASRLYGASVALLLVGLILAIVGR
jgi:hypothetical protein